MRRAATIAICSLVAATPALAAGEPFGGSWFDTIYVWGMFVLFGFLAVGSGFVIGSYMNLFPALLVILLLSSILPLLVYFTMDMERAKIVVLAEGAMLAMFSPAIVLGWWLAWRSRPFPRTTFHVGSHDG